MGLFSILPWREIVEVGIVIVFCLVLLAWQSPELCYRRSKERVKNEATQS